MTQKLYACTQFANGSCSQWQIIELPPSALESLAITRQDAFDLSSVIIGLFFMAWCAGFFGRVIMSNEK